MKTIKTERQFLRAWQPDDVEVFYRLLSNNDVVKCLGGKPLASLNDAEEAIRHYLETGSSMAICLSNGEVIGQLAFGNADYCQVTPKDFQYEIGFAFLPEHWGNGYATEMCKAFIDHLVTDLNAKSIWMRHFDFNAGSKRVIEKCGLEFEFYVERILRNWNVLKANHLYYKKTY